MHSLSVVSLQLISSHFESSYFDLTVYRKHNSSKPSSRQHTGRPLLCSLSSHTAFCHVPGLGSGGRALLQCFQAGRSSGSSNTLTAHPLGCHAGQYEWSLLPEPLCPSETGSDNRSFSSGPGKGCMAGQDSRLLKPCPWQPIGITCGAARVGPRGPSWGNTNTVLRIQNYILGTSAARLLCGWVASHKLIVLTCLLGSLPPSQEPEAPGTRGAQHMANPNFNSNIQLQEQLLDPQAPLPSIPQGYSRRSAYSSSCI